MAAGVTDRLWEISDLVAMLEAWESKARCQAYFRGYGVENRWRLLCEGYASEFGAREYQRVRD